MNQWVVVTQGQWTHAYGPFSTINKAKARKQAFDKRYGGEIKTSVCKMQDPYDDPPPTAEDFGL